ncbi:MAG: BLUF domain-containing protein [Planctomycetota bacterium]
MPPTRPLFHLTYVSHRATGVTDDDVIDGIVLPAMAKNYRLGVTGCLWFGRERFVQVLEGERATVEDLFDAIRVDERHYSVDLLGTEPIAERNFARFSMRTIASDAPESIATLIREASERPPGPAVASEAFRCLVRRAIADLAAWPMRGHVPPASGTI